MDILIHLVDQGTLICFKRITEPHDLSRKQATRHEVFGMEKTMKKETSPYEIDLLDLINEVGGMLQIEFNGITINLTQEQLQIMRDAGAKTDVMSCVLAGMAYSGKTVAEAISFIEEGLAKRIAPKVSFEAADGESLNIKSREENPKVEQLVQAIKNHNVN